MFSRLLVLPASALALALTLAACDDATSFRFEPVIVEDTVEVFAPTPANDGQPTALDITARGTLLSGARFPERPEQAGEFDFLVRQREGGLALVPGGALGTGSNAGITRALPGQTFQGLKEAPGSSAFLTDTAVVVRTGEVFAARSRTFGRCVQFAKLQPLEVDPQAGRLVVRVATNQNCGDPRLVRED